MPRGKPSSQDQSLVEPVAGNGLLDRRFLLKQSIGLLGAAGLAAASTLPAHTADPPHLPAWMQFPGAGMSGYGSPAKYESKVMRSRIESKPGTTGSGASRTPIEALDGMITPNGLHYERHHSGVPDIAPDTHRLLIHGMVKRPLTFTVEALLRYPMVSRIHFLECSGGLDHRVGPLWPLSIRWSLFPARLSHDSNILRQFVTDDAGRDEVEFILVHASPCDAARTAASQVFFSGRSSRTAVGHRQSHSKGYTNATKDREGFWRGHGHDVSGLDLGDSPGPGDDLRQR